MLILLNVSLLTLMPITLSERVVVDGHGCHTAPQLGVRAKENQDKVPLYTDYLNSIKKHIKQYVLLIPVLERQQNFLNC